MAIPKTELLPLLLLLISTTHLSLSARPNPHRPPTTTTTTTPPISIHDLLPQYGLPKGLLPNAVDSYSLSEDDGTFTVNLKTPCYVYFDDQLVYYDHKITGTLTYGSVSGVSGIQAKKLFLWVTVTGMNVDSDPGFIVFHVGALSKKLPAEEFESVPDCKSKGCFESHLQSI